MTASGGPFRTWSTGEISNASRKEALNHPNWEMGPKITIDSATLMNKGLEVIEARWLFDTDPDHVDVVVHPESIVHSLVEFVDGSVLAQLGLPDMKVPISVALSFPERLELDLPSLDLTETAIRADPGWFSPRTNEGWNVWGGRFVNESALNNWRVYFRLSLDAGCRDYGP